MRSAFQRWYLGLAVCALVAIAGLFGPASSAQASFFDRIKDIYQLPSNVEQIQKDYDAAKQQLEEQKGKIDEQQEKLSEAMRQSKETEEKLLSQNDALKQENEQLQARLKAMEELAQNKEKRNRKITTMILTVIGLVIGYFVIGRVVRFVLWRNRRRAIRK
ncbi:hypothetical protein [Paenibacillus ferrarius]|uniref:hypothetical protein n=1 Tax=Paenibacillus ferrarius TaxID=1469647 RepID=UPI003D2B0C8B